MAMPFYKECMPFRSEWSIVLCLFNVGNVTCPTPQIPQMVLALAEPQPTLHTAKSIYCQLHQFKGAAA